MSIEVQTYGIFALVVGCFPNIGLIEYLPYTGYAYRCWFCKRGLNKILYLTYIFKALAVTRNFETDIIAIDMHVLIIWFLQQESMEMTLNWNASTITFYMQLL